MYFVFMSMLLGAMLGAIIGLLWIKRRDRLAIQRVTDIRARNEARFKEWRSKFPEGTVSEPMQAFIDGPYAGRDYIHVMKELGFPCPKPEAIATRDRAIYNLYAQKSGSTHP